MRVLIYTYSASGDPTQLRSQQDALEEWAAGEGHEIVEVYSETGRERRHADGFGAAERAVEVQAEGVAVTRWDRLTRDVNRFTTLMGLLADFDLTVFSVETGESYYARDPDDVRGRELAEAAARAEWEARGGS